MLCEYICTFGSSEHRGGQLTLLRLYVAQGEPARVAVGHHRHDVVGSRQVAGRGRRLQNRQPDGDTDTEICGFKQRYRAV